MIGNLLERAVARVDTWLNAVTGVGLASGRTAYEYVAPPRLSDQALEDLYGDPFAGRICRLLPAEALRQGFLVQANGEAALETALATRLRELGTSEALFAAWTWSRVFGGGAVLVNADDGRDPSEPLDRKSIRTIHSLVPLNRRELIPLRWYTDPLSREYGSVERYTLARMGGQSADTRSVHATRLLKFRGQLVTHQREIALQGWGESELQRIYPVLQQFNGAFAATSTLLNDASQGVFSIKDFLEMMAGGKRELLMQRLALMDATRSSGRSIMVDADTEKYEKVETAALSGLPDVLKLYLLLLAGATGIPVTLLMGQAPSGLQATGEMDVRNWYDLVKTEQVQTAQPHIETLIDLITLCQDGPTQGRPVETTIEFAPLWQPTPKERADERLVVAQTDQIYLAEGVVLPEEVAASRFREKGWSSETTIDLEARRAALEADREAGRLPTPPAAGGAPGGGPAGLLDAATSQTPAGTDHAEGAMGIIAKVAAREIPRDAGVALLVSSMGMAPDAAEAAMGESGRTFFTAPDPAAGDELAALRAENAKLKASNQGHQAYTARVVQAAKNGTLQLGKFTARPPTETAEGDTLAEGDVVAVPVEDAGAEPTGGA